MKYKASSFKKNVLIVLSLMSAIFSSQLSAQCSPEGDSLALVVFYHATGGENWTNNTNWLVEGQPINTWFGVSTNDGGCIDSLDLGMTASNNLVGEIPSEIGTLTNLVYLYLYNNHLTGNIPTEIGDLSILTTLSLGQNDLSGSIPAEIGGLSNLSTLYLYSNELSGPIPAEIGNLLNMETLFLYGNELSGAIPAEIGNLSNLSTLYLFNNSLTGAIPVEMWSMSSLMDVNLNRNLLSGNIAPEIENASALTILDLSSNQLTGSIPPEVGNLTQLADIYWSDNQLTGSIPPEIGDLISLDGLGLSRNQLTGEIPVEIANISGLSILDLNENQLTGHIPVELGDMPNLQFLALNDNQLTGRLPVGLANNNIISLELSNNQLYGCFPSQYTIFCDTNSSFENNAGLPNNGDFTAFCEDGTGVCTPSIIGQVIIDLNQNCEIDDIDTGLQNWMIKASTATENFYSISDENGRYVFFIPPGEYTVELINPESSIWEENCTGIATVDIVDPSDLEIVNFFPTVLTDCALMTVDISTPFLRRCFPNTYVVNFCNNGTITAENARIEVFFDAFINIDSTSIPIVEQIEQISIFELGDIAPNQCGSFLIHTTINCDINLGETLCVTAHIYPDSICAEVSPEWSGATVAVQGECGENEVRFEIENVGDENMVEALTYIIVEDALILLEMPETFILNSAQSVAINLPANGSTYTLRAMQVSNHPVPSMPTIFIEGCGTNGSGEFSTGFVTQFPEDDNAFFVSIDCQEVVGSFDPNDKSGYPKGYAEEHYIEKKQDIEYHIRFQNTGTDTAFTVMIEDIISLNLEMTSLKLGVSSHPYKVEFGQHNELRFIFENINLLDSFSNEPASHGFVKFKISQKEDLMIGTQIENTASIFFDFNEAVVTNTTLHTIGEDFVEIVATEQPFIPNLKVSLAPNPVINEATIRLSGLSFKNAQLSLFNTVGLLIKQEYFIGNEFMLKRGDLPAGVYFFEVLVDSKKGFAGKLVVQ